MTANGIHSLADMIGDPNTTTPEGRAVPLPYLATFPQRLRAAWWVLAGRAFAVRWPEPGELEQCVNPIPRRTSMDASDD